MWREMVAVVSPISREAAGSRTADARSGAALETLPVRDEFLSRLQMPSSVIFRRSTRKFSCSNAEVDLTAVACTPARHRYRSCRRLPRVVDIGVHSASCMLLVRKSLQQLRKRHGRKILLPVVARPAAAAAGSAAERPAPAARQGAEGRKARQTSQNSSSAAYKAASGTAPRSSDRPAVRTAAGSGCLAPPRKTDAAGIDVPAGR